MKHRRWLGFRFGMLFTSCFLSRLLLLATRPEAGCNLKIPANPNVPGGNDAYRTLLAYMVQKRWRNYDAYQMRPGGQAPVMWHADPKLEEPTQSMVLSQNPEQQEA